jgi:hypothetical protein
MKAFKIYTISKKWGNVNNCPYTFLVSIDYINTNTKKELKIYVN